MRADRAIKQVQDQASNFHSDICWPVLLIRFLLIFLTVLRKTNLLLRWTFDPIMVKPLSCAIDPTKHIFVVMPSERKSYCYCCIFLPFLNFYNITLKIIYCCTFFFALFTFFEHVAVFYFLSQSECCTKCTHTETESNNAL